MNILSSIVSKLVHFGVKERKVAIAVTVDERPVENHEEEFDWSEEKQKSLLKVKKLRPIIIWDPKSPIVFQDPLSFELHCNAKCKDYMGRDVEGEFFYFPPVGTVFEAGLHDLKINFVPKKSFKYSCGEMIKTIEVKKKVPSFSWNPYTTHFIYLTPLPQELFDGLQCELDGGHIEYSHTPGVILEVGTHKIVAAYHPSSEENRNFRKAYASVEILVTGTVVNTLWSLPLSVTQPSSDLPIKRRLGERLGEALRFMDPLPKWIFCASAAIPDVEGIFIYDRQPGEVLPAGFHEIGVEFKPTDARKFYGSKASVTIFINKAIVDLQWEKPFAIPHGEPLDEYALRCTNTDGVEGVYQYNPTFGTILPEGVHELTVDFFPLNENYLPATITQHIKILPKRELKILWFEPEEIVHPEPLSRAQLNATLVGAGSKCEGKFHYNPDFGTILDAGVHNLNVTFIPVKESFAIANCTVQLKVLQGQSRLTWTIPESILEGEALYDNVLNCRCTNVPEGSFLYDPPFGTILPPGCHKLKATFHPTNGENFRSSSTTISLLVRERPRFSPRIVWANPICEPLLYGIPLNTTMLNAQCNNAFGSFLYDPPPGTILPVGTHRLTVRFTPDDPSKCLSGTAESAVTILKRMPVMVWKPQIQEVTYGFPLDDTVLNAFVVMGEDDQRRVEGKFTFKPPLNTVLNSGDHSLMCDFKPHDSRNFYSITHKVSLFVHRITPQIVWNLPSTNPVYPMSLDMCIQPPICSDPTIKGHFEYRFDFRAILPSGDYILQCHFYPEDIINYYGADASLEITIKPGVPTIAWEPSTTLIYGSPITKMDHCNAYADLAGGTFEYDPPEGTFLSAGGNIKFTMIYTPDDLKNYTVVTMTKYLQVEKRIPFIEWHCSSKLIYGIPLSSDQLNARLSTEENSKSTLEDLADSVFLYTPGIGTLLSAGRDIQLRLDFIPSEKQQRNYQSATKCITIEVIPRTPKIRWKPKSLHLVEGDPLSEDHLNAFIREENLNPGTIVYHPPLGTKFPSGRYLVELQFIPLYPENCRATRMSLNFDVAKRPPKLIWVNDPVTGKMKCIKEQVAIDPTEFSTPSQSQSIAFEVADS